MPVTLCGYVPASDCLHYFPMDLFVFRCCCTISWLPSNGLGSYDAELFGTQVGPLQKGDVRVWGSNERAAYQPSLYPGISE